MCILPRTALSFRVIACIKYLCLPSTLCSLEGRIVCYPYRAWKTSDMTRKSLHSSCCFFFSLGHFISECWAECSQAHVWISMYFLFFFASGSSVALSTHLKYICQCVSHGSAQRRHVDPFLHLDGHRYVQSLGKHTNAGCNPKPHSNKSKGLIAVFLFLFLFFSVNNDFIKFDLNFDINPQVSLFILDMECGIVMNARGIYRTVVLQRRKRYWQEMKALWSMWHT